MLFLVFFSVTPPPFPPSWGWKVQAPKRLLRSWRHICTSTELHEWSENVVNVENCNFLKVNCGFLLVIWVKWKQSVRSITLLYSSTFYSLFLPFFVLEIYKFKHDKFFVRNSAAISEFDWFEQPWVQLI